MTVVRDTKLTLRTRADRQRLTGPGLRAFWNLARLWSLTDREQMRLLGISGKSTLRRWRGGKVTALRADTFERLSLIFGIFRAINELLGPGEQADRWLRAPNRAPLFGGQSALDLMLSGRVGDLHAVQDYLRGIQSGWLG